MAPVENNPLDPSYVNVTTATGTVTPIIGGPLKAGTTLDSADIITQIKAALPLITFAYGVWATYMQTTKQGLTNTIYKDADVIIGPILAKDPTVLTNVEAEQFIGAAIAVLEQAGKDVIQKLTPFLGQDILAILSAFGLLTGV